ncbi:MAG: helix-hairpin-helix domain-containing protein [Desulfuromonadales bacterium]|nr:helix-hairpin-helix domain-containing protein [Desulfuromonadales bacterium]
MKKLFVAFVLACCVIVSGFAVGPVLAADQVAAADVAGVVNLNQANVSELQELPGVGPALAERILAYREAQGPFRSVDQLTEVKGIGARKLEKIRGSVTLK